MCVFEEAVWRICGCVLAVVKVKSMCVNKTEGFGLVCVCVGGCVCVYVCVCTPGSCLPHPERSWQCLLAVTAPTCRHSQGTLLRCQSFKCMCACA